MSVMEKRLQLLLDTHRWELVSREAERERRSAASVIRDAIDLYFRDASGDARRADAARRFLELSADAADEVQVDDIGAVLDDDLESYLDKKLQR